MLSAGSYEPAPTQAGKMVRDLRLGLPGRDHQFADRPLRLRDELQDRQPYGVAEGAEVLRQDVDGCRRAR